MYVGVWLYLCMVGLGSAIFLGSGSIDGHSMQHLVEQLQCTMQMHFYPAGRLFNGLTRIIRSPALHKAKPQYAQATQIIHTNASGSGDAYNTIRNTYSNKFAIIYFYNSVGLLLPPPPICWLETPATAAACAAAAACALVASECIC